MSHEFKSFNRLNSVEESPCSSPHSDGLPSDALLKPDCAQHRKDFYFYLMKKIKLGSSYHKQKESMDSPHLNTSDNIYDPSDRWREDYHNALWLEIRSRLADRDVDEFEKYLLKQRREYSDVLDDIMKLKFNQKALNNSMTSDYNGTSSTINLFTDGHRDSSPNQSSSTLVDLSITTAENEDEQRENDIGFQIADFSSNEDEQLEEESSIDDGEREYMDHWLNQEEMYTTTAWDFGDLSVVAVDKEYAERVTSIMKRLDRFERLFPNLKSLARRDSKFRNVKLQKRIQTLTMWSNMVQNLSRQFALMSKELTVNIKSNDTFCNYQNVDLDPDERLRSSTVDITALGGTDHQNHLNSSFTQTTPTSHSGSPNREIPLKSQSSKTSDITIVLSNVENDDTDDKIYLRDSNDLNEEQDLEHTPTDTHDDNADTPCYKLFVERSLKLMGVEGLMDRLRTLLKMTVDNARFALEKPNVFSGGDTIIDERRHLIYEHGAWSSEFQEMQLPTFRRAVLTLLKIPLDVLHECLQIRLEHLPSTEPSSFSIEQVIKPIIDY